MTALTGVGNRGLGAGAYPLPFWLQGGAEFACAVKLLTSSFYYLLSFYCSFTSIRKEDARLVFPTRTGD